MFSGYILVSKVIREGKRYHSPFYKLVCFPYVLLSEHNGTTAVNEDGPRCERGLYGVGPADNKHLP